MPVFATIKPLEWENNFFGINSALLDFSAPQPLTEAQLAGCGLLQAKLGSHQTTEIDALSAIGFRLVEGEADLLIAINATQRQSGIRIARAEHIPPLRAVASEVFANSRFRAPWYQPGDSGRFYAQWIENAVRGTFDHQCLLAVDEAGAMEGFVSLRELGNGEARIGLLASLPGSRGKGVGQRLMQAAADWCQARRIPQLRVATQLSNLAAMRLYLSRGATLESTAYWLYR
ncbi:dTDP-4-amino-4,6-dideoxy-D-galactose acyltransferase [Erwiniaceae bacterium BAC15a-03b]|uniref:dTDP-fucosamine acetyltransferase n=1 Tax=Winslowiella arboricola TaxID=2978220 RepID=A0A9J6PK25_9GAMM|nr:dTDP-4-amino-4,6-dideoxy-D-galactose acyltransferase [Winslowiella arboricola]MCU5772209.1 dTDP-4-amino-4,6-dideoxy-D-galactose acyltransferase [Winslowiella arboricola]MCU5776064.1 dTDP-4-amino-4,6-dideoxy-D-galactose acyltransferase [Winslowiella arboricola]